MGGTGMAGKGPRIVDVLGEIAHELRVANTLAALRMGATGLEHDPGDRVKTEVTRARVARMNRLRANARVGLGIEEGS